MIFPTLSCQLACRFPDFASLVLSTLQSRPGIGQESLINQLNELLIKPLKATRLSIIIAIDALDECKDTEPASVILSLLARYIADIPKVKFFVTGRPEPRIRTGFRLPVLQPVTKIFVLQDVARSDVDHDIQRFLKTCLSDGVKGRSDVDLLLLWPSDDEIRLLTEKCGQLFIYAATAVSFMISPIDQPSERLALLIQFPEKNRGIDALYSTVLENGFPAQHVYDGYLNASKSVIASVVLAYNPLSRRALAMLLGLKPEKVASLIRSLHAVLRVPKDVDQPIVVYHKSFPDFITDGARCSNPRFFVDPAHHHLSLATCCLELMNTHLCKNVCNLPRYAMNQDLGLEERRRIIGDALEYACRFWADHLSQTKPKSCDMIWSLLEEFLTKKQMFWYEVLSLVEDLQHAILSLEKLGRWLGALRSGTPEDPSILLDWIVEGRSFISEFYGCAKESARHLYHSALPLTPTNSLLRRSHRVDLEEEVAVIYGLDDYRSTTPLLIRMENTKIRDIRFSPGGSFLIAAFDSFMQIFDPTTGELIHRLHTPNTCTFDVSSDDSLLVEASVQGERRIWDLQTGGLVLQTPRLHEIDHLDPVYSCIIRYSPNGSWTALAAGPHIWIWDSVSLSLHSSCKIDCDHFIWIGRFEWFDELSKTFIACICSDYNGHTVDIIDASDGSRKRRICEQTTWGTIQVSAVHSIVVCLYETELHIYDTKSSALLRKIPRQLTPGISCDTFAFSSVDPFFIATFAFMTSPNYTISDRLL
jgi:hypothetical protein